MLRGPTFGALGHAEMEGRADGCELGEGLHKEAVNVPCQRKDAHEGDETCVEQANLGWLGVRLHRRQNARSTGPHSHQQGRRGGTLQAET